MVSGTPIPPPAFSVEPLERREFLSADVQTWSNGPTVVNRLEVVEIEAADDGDDIAIAPGDLPPTVLSGLNDRYPEAAILQAALTSEAGDYEYELVASVDGKMTTVILDTDGRIVETAETVSAEDLPAAVRKWVRSAFPRASIADAAFVNTPEGSSYDLVLASAGRVAMEAKVRFAPATTVPFAWRDGSIIQATPQSHRADAAPAFRPHDRARKDVVVTARRADGASPATDDLSPPTDTPAANTDSPATYTVPGPNDVPPVKEAVAAAQSLIATAIAAAVRSVASPAWLALRGNSSAIDARTLAQKLGAILDEIRVASEFHGGQSLQGAAGTKIAAAAALLLGSHLLLSQRRTQCASDVATPATSTWRWMLGGSLSREHSWRRATRSRVAHGRKGRASTGRGRP